METFSGALIAVTILMHIVFIFAVIFRRNDLADIVWGPGFILLTAGALAARWYQGFSLSYLGAREFIAFACVTIWGLRLFTHVSFRNLKKSEDPRYKKWREEWGKTWVWRSYLQVFILQGIIMFIIGLPLIFTVQGAPTEIDLWVYAGLLFWVCGFIFESVGDHQLNKFKKDPSNKGKLMTTGLWSWSRHPNYFGEVLQWWGIFVMTLGLPNAWIGILSPLAITYLILKVSGIPMLEKMMESRPHYQDYVRRTSVFFPMPPRGGSSGNGSNS